MRYLIYDPLTPHTPEFTGGRITDSDLLPLEAAAKMATKHAGEEVTPLDFVLAAARDEISLLAYLPRSCKMIYCETGKETEAPQGAIVQIPASACVALALWGETQWREIEQKVMVTDENSPFEWGAINQFSLADDEADFVTRIDRIAVKGGAIHALADAFKEEQSQPNSRKRLSDENIECIHEQIANRVTQKDIAAQFGVSSAYISQLKKQRALELGSKSPNAFELFNRRPRS